MISSPFVSVTFEPSRSLPEFSLFKNEPQSERLALLLCSKSQRLFLLPAESEVTRVTPIVTTDHGGGKRRAANA